jgi:hypothetical protein
LGAVLKTSDRAAFQQLARDELAGLYAQARRLSGRDAEDLVQEALAAGMSITTIVQILAAQIRLGAEGRKARVHDPSARCLLDICDLTHLVES